MNKIVLTNLFSFIIGGIIFGGIVYAANYQASDIIYIKDGNEINVNEALNDLYETSKPKSVSAVQYGGQYANLSSTTFSLTGIPNYNKLVLNKNLFVRVSIVQGNNNGLSNQQSYVNISYNASSGTLTVQNSYNGCFVYFYVYYIPQE